MTTLSGTNHFTFTPLTPSQYKGLADILGQDTGDESQDYQKIINHINALQMSDFKRMNRKVPESESEKKAETQQAFSDYLEADLVLYPDRNEYLNSKKPESLNQQLIMDHLLNLSDENLRQKGDHHQEEYSIIPTAPVVIKADQAPAVWEEVVLENGQTPTTWLADQVREYQSSKPIQNILRHVIKALNPGLDENQPGSETIKVPTEELLHEIAAALQRSIRMKSFGSELSEIEKLLYKAGYAGGPSDTVLGQQILDEFSR